MAAALPRGARMEQLGKDLRHSIRALRAEPGFALVAVLTLALGIGATTAIFSIVNGVLLRPLPLHDPAKLIMVWETRPGEQAGEVASPGTFVEWTRQTKPVFSDLAATFDWEMSLLEENDPEVVRAGYATGTLFATLGAKPLLGRGLTPADVGAKERSAVLGYDLWQRRFGGDPRAIGKGITLGRRTYTVVGVMPREFLVPRSRAAVWLPFDHLDAPPGRYLVPIARLAPGVTAEQAQAAMDVISRRLAAANPAENANWGAHLVPLHEEVVGKVRRALLITLASVALLLLMACVNIANLLLSRAAGRAKEMAIRAALGASRTQLVRQLLTESLVLAVLAGACGAFLAHWITQLFVRFLPESMMLPRMSEIAVDGRVLAVTALVSIVTGVLCGLAPALEGSRTNLRAGLTSSTRGSSQDRHRKGTRSTLVAVEFAVAALLLVVAGLLVKTFARLEQVNPGVRRDGALTMRVVMPRGHQEPAQRSVMLNTMLENVRAVSGVRHAGAVISLSMPFSDALTATSFEIEGRPKPKAGEEPAADVRPIAGEYFAAMGMPMLRGRAIDPERNARSEVVVNEAFAAKYFAGQNALGRRLRFSWGVDIDAEIVGIAGNVRASGLDKPAAPAIYMSYLNDEKPQFVLIVASSLSPDVMEKPVVHAVRAAHPLTPINDVRPLGELVSGTIARPRFNAAILALFAALGLLLAAVGIYGVLSYTVSQRVQELGIRMALGAGAADVQRLVVRDGLAIAVTGIAIGLAAAAAATRLLASLLQDVDPTDPAVFAGVAVALALVAIAASYIPAHRATRVDPMSALNRG